MTTAQDFRWTVLPETVQMLSELNLEVMLTIPRGHPFYLSKESECTLSSREELGKVLQAKVLMKSDAGPNHWIMCWLPVDSLLEAQAQYPKWAGIQVANLNDATKACDIGYNFAVFPWGKGGCGVLFASKLSLAVIGSLLPTSYHEDNLPEKRIRYYIYHGDVLDHLIKAGVKMD